MKYPCIKRAKNPEASLEVNSSTSTSCLLCCPSVWATVFLCVLFYPITPHFDTGQACSPSLPNSCGARSGRWWKRNKMNWQGLMSAPSSVGSNLHSFCLTALSSLLWSSGLSKYNTDLVCPCYNSDWTEHIFIFTTYHIYIYIYYFL